MASKVPIESTEGGEPVWFEDPRKAGANEYVPCLSYNSKPLAKPERDSLEVLRSC
jgi:hypothetical protein